MVFRVHGVLQVLLVAGRQVHSSMFGLGLDVVVVRVVLVLLGYVALGLVSVGASLGLGMGLALQGVQSLLVCLGVCALVLGGSGDGTLAQVVAWLQRSSDSVVAEVVGLILLVGHGWCARVKGECVCLCVFVKGKMYLWW